MPPMALTEVTAGAWLDRDAVLSDLDGCLIAGEQALPGARALVAACGARLWIVSNNSTDDAAGLSARLARLGLDAAADRIVLAGEETIRALARAMPGARVALFAAAPLVRLAQALGLQPDDERPDVAVLARDPGFSLARLGLLAALMRRGVALHLTNPDLSHPGPDGAPVPETGALLAAVAAVAAPGAVICLGKPAPTLLQIALGRAGVAPGAAVYLGDTPETDGLAARAAGVAFVQIARPGEAARLEGVAAC